MNWCSPHKAWATIPTNPPCSASARTASIEYDMTWRQNAYYNPGLVVANGTHFRDTTYRWQDNDLTLIPGTPLQAPARLQQKHGSRPRTLQPTVLSMAAATSFPFFANIKREFNTYRLGGEIDFPQDPPPRDAPLGVLQRRHPVFPERSHNRRQPAPIPPRSPNTRAPSPITDRLPDGS